MSYDCRVADPCGICTQNGFDVSTPDDVQVCIQEEMGPIVLEAFQEQDVLKVLKLKDITDFVDVECVGNGGPTQLCNPAQPSPNVAFAASGVEFGIID
jgi:hypothetical protein